MKDRILECFEKKKQWTIKDLERKLKCQSSKDFTQLIQALNALEDERILCNNHSVYFYIDQKEFVVGKVKDISKYEFMVSNGEDKVYVPKKYGRNAFDKDEVLVHCTKKKNEIIHIYSRGITKVTGTFYRRKGQFIFYSDVDLHASFQIQNLDEFNIEHRMKALVLITKYTNPLQCRIEKLLGYEYEKGMDITSILSANNVRQHFSDKVLAQADAMPKEVQEAERQGRSDFRDLMTVTIDGDDAKDFDDAISIEKTQQGYRLYVHIADVSHYVKEGSPIDQEAFARSTSIYVADRVVPMLPFALSNGICSLNPHVDRCTLSCVMDIDFSGRCLHHEIVPSLIHSNQRCTYAKVNRFLQGDEQAQKEYEDIQELLYSFEACAKLLQARSHDRGTIDFNTKEPKLVLDEEGKCIDVQCRERGFAEQMIEEAMILANVCVAHTLNTCKIPGIYRVHETPDPKKVSHLTMLAHSLGIRTSFYPDSVTTKEMQQFLESIQDPALCDVLSYVALRAMQKARYDANCLGHFGLSLSEYCHFTSPIRRYADLVVHRMLRKYLFLQNKQDKNTDLAKCERQAFYISGKEKDAVNVERQVNDYKRAEYMEDKIGQIFKGNIVSVHNFGFFVELPNTVEGLVPIHYLDDYFDFDEVASRLISQDRKKIYTIGQKVKVVCESVDKLKGQVSFVLK